jgi:hypothetical protein
MAAIMPPVANRQGGDEPTIPARYEKVKPALAAPVRHAEVVSATAGEVTDARS